MKDIEISFHVMVLAFKSGEDINKAVPIDICEIENKTISPHLALQKGNYKIVIVNKDKDAKKFELEVE